MKLKPRHMVPLLREMSQKAQLQAAIATDDPTRSDLFRRISADADRLAADLVEYITISQLENEPQPTTPDHDDE